MTDLRTAAQQALEALEDTQRHPRKKGKHMNLGDEHDYNTPNALFLADVLERSAQTHTQANAAAEMRRLVAQRDALLAALKEAFRAFAFDDEGPVWADSTIAKARAAIKQAEEKA